MPSKYPASERVTPSRLRLGDSVLIRERMSDQPYGRGVDGPLAVGVWTVLALTTRMDHGHRRAQRTYVLTIEHTGGEQRTLHASPSERFNRVT